MPVCPPPYRAALALSIDCDGCTVERLNRVLGYWATDESTPLGRGLGLPVASSMFAYSRNPTAPPQAAYLDGDRDGLREAYRRGWIDSLHSVGDFAADRRCTRDLARRAFDALADDGIRLAVWTNHGGPENIQNILREEDSGDVPDGPCYLADLAEQYGVRFVWASELTPVVGQGRESSPAEFYGSYVERSGAARWAARVAHPLGTFLVGKLGFSRYAGNRLLESKALRDGRRTLVFRRYGRWRHDTISRLPSILSRETLDRLEASGGAMVVYLHVGPSPDETPQSFAAGMRALEDVARRYAAKTLWVARTSDLLDRAARAEGPEAHSPR